MPVCDVHYGGEVGDLRVPCWGWIISRPNSGSGIAIELQMGSAGGNPVCFALSAFSDRGNITAISDLLHGDGHAALDQFWGGAPATTAGRAAWWYDDDSRHLKTAASVAAKGAGMYRSVAGWPLAALATGSSYLC
jgi:hypothetical protein